MNGQGARIFHFLLLLHEQFCASETSQSDRDIFLESCLYMCVYAHVDMHACVAENNLEHHFSGAIYLRVFETLSLSSLELTVEGRLLDQQAPGITDFHLPSTGISCVDYHA